MPQIYAQCVCVSNLGTGFAFGVENALAHLHSRKAMIQAKSVSGSKEMQQEQTWGMQTFAMCPLSVLRASG